MSPYDRLINGFEIFNRMMFSLIRHDITPMRIEMWEEREPNDQELLHVFPVHLRRLMRTQKYWAIKEPGPRNTRSAENHLSYEVANKFITVEQLKHIWSSFVMNLIQIYMNARSQKKTLNWSCNFTRLYDDYLIHRSVSTSSYDVNCIMTFDKYLFSNIKPNWDCNNADNLMSSSAWCQAWKRFMTQIEIDIKVINVKNSTEPKTNKQLSESYLQDVEILMQWLSSLMGLKECKNIGDRFDELNHLVKPQQKPLKPPADVSSHAIDTFLCYLTTFAFAECNRMFTKSKILFVS